MIRFSFCASTLRLQAATLSGLIAGFVLVSSASALTLDFNVPSGNYTTASNWIDTTDPIPVPAASAPDSTYFDPNANAVTGDFAYVRNGGTVTINSDVAARELRVGYTFEVTNPDYNGSTVVDAGDYVLWRTGEVLPVATDVVTPGTTTPEDYDFWRLRYGGTPVSENIGQAGTLNWTAGKFTGPPVNFSLGIGGPQIRVGRLELVGPTGNQVPVQVPGTVVQNGPTTELLLLYRQSRLDIGDSGDSVSSPTPLSSYTFNDGTIGLAVSSDNILNNQGSNGNNGINVKNGTFTMTGGRMIDVTPSSVFNAGARTQRFLTIASVAGTTGNEAVSTATISGGDINVLGGIRMASQNNVRAYLNITGGTLVTGGDTQVGASGVNSESVMTMTGGSFQVGRYDTVPHYEDPMQSTALLFQGRFIVGDVSKGTVNMSGGSINATRNVVVGNNQNTVGSAINLTGGTITTPGIEMRRNGAISDASNGDDAARITVDGPTASFITTGQSGTNFSPGCVIGNFGKATFEVKNGGTAVLGGGGSNIIVGNNANTKSTIILNGAGSKLTLGGPMSRAQLASAAPVVSLTGGTLEFNNPISTAAQSFTADLTNTSTELITKTGALLQVTVGNRTQPLANNFAMSGGSWNIDIDKDIVTTLGADWFNASAGTASLTGGTLNINFLNGTPTDLQAFRILRGGTGTTLTAGAVTFTGAGAGHWELKEIPFAGTPDVNYPNDEEIQLIYHVAPFPGSGAGLSSVSAVPEPSSAVLVVFAAAGMLTARRRSRTCS